MSKTGLVHEEFPPFKKKFLPPNGLLEMALDGAEYFPLEFMLHKPIKSAPWHGKVPSFDLFI